MRFATLGRFQRFHPSKCIHLQLEYTHPNQTFIAKQYLKEPWYAIFNQWDELSFHSEDISEDETTADLVVSYRVCVGRGGGGEGKRSASALGPGHVGSKHEGIDLASSKAMGWVKTDMHSTRKKRLVHASTCECEDDDDNNNKGYDRVSTEMLSQTNTPMAVLGAWSVESTQTLEALHSFSNGAGNYARKGAPSEQTRYIFFWVVRQGSLGCSSQLCELFELGQLAADGWSCCLLLCSSCTITP